MDYVTASEYVSRLFFQPLGDVWTDAWEDSGQSFSVDRKVLVCPDAVRVFDEYDDDDLIIIYERGEGSAWLQTTTGNQPQQQAFSLMAYLTDSEASFRFQERFQLLVIEQPTPLRLRVANGPEGGYNDQQSHYVSAWDVLVSP